jgi:hypothetical protein
MISEKIAKIHNSKKRSSGFFTIVQAASTKIIGF